MCPILDEEPGVPSWLQGTIADYFILRAASMPEGPIRMVDCVAYAGVAGISRDEWPGWLQCLQSADNAWGEAQAAKLKK